MFKEIAEKLNIEFVSCLNFEKTKKFGKRLLVFDGSFVEIHQDKKVKVAVGGRHEKIHCILLKHNLFHQRKLSRTNDHNATPVDLFKSPRDVQQLDDFGREINKLEFIRDCYQKTTLSSYGNFLVDFDPKTSHSLRFRSNTTGSGPTILRLY